MNANTEGRDANGGRKPRIAMWRIFGLSALGGLGGIPLIEHPDERIAETNRLWAARSGAFLSIALGMDIIIRALVLRQDPTLYWDIALIYLVNLFAANIGRVRSGVPAAETTGKITWKFSGLMVMIIAVEVPALLWLTGQVRSWTGYFAMAALAGASATVMLLLMRALYCAWERRAVGSSGSEE